jgi:hypothetical protein
VSVVLSKFTRPDGKSVYINPEQVSRVAPADSPPGAQTVIETLTGMQVVREPMEEVIKILRG